ncbi:uncharacterized protein LOC126740626 [Anthonomus grandis grandis]|uniref:uncharacterized protein LOC126740626 n=1 Tax=Anthonomus grandis grandis TaxID=2921223 RepID=UPI00216557C7|nr:uncharacterized protein LOC126740626 [Anthonomus grandis grandis]
MSKRFFDPLVEKDAEILRKLAEDDSSVLSDAEESSKGEEDAVETQLESSDTEQEISSEDDEEVEEPVVNTILGKDKITRWKLQMPVQNVRTRSHICNHWPMTVFYSMLNVGSYVMHM